MWARAVCPWRPAEFVHDYKFDWERADWLRPRTGLWSGLGARPWRRRQATFVPLRAEQDLRMQLGAKLFTRMDF